MVNGEVVRADERSTRVTGSVLVLNTRKSAQDLFCMLKNHPKAEVYH
jgi:hypothetical protein